MVNKNRHWFSSGLFAGWDGKESREVRKIAERSLVGLGLVFAGCGVLPSMARAQEAFEAAPAVSHPAAKPAPQPKKPPPPKPAAKAPAAAKPGPVAAPAAPPADVHRFENWAVSCAPKAAPTDPANCLGLVSVARDKQDQRKIVIMGLIKRNGTFSFFAQTPTAIELKSGVDIQFEGRATRHYDYNSCEPALCTVMVPLDDALLGDVTGVPNVTMLWTSLEAGQVKVVFSPAGAREAFEYLRAQ